MRFSLIPRHHKFYDLFEEDAQNLVKGARLLQDMLQKWDNLDARSKEITDIEHQGDSITHRIMAELHSTFVTPIDREDIAVLAHTMDDVLDFIQSAADFMLLYGVPAPTERARELGAIIAAAASELERAMPSLRHPGRLKDIMAHCVELNRLENAADDIYRAALRELFQHTGDMSEVIKWREIYEHLESATDRCEDVANVLEGVALKHA